VVGTGGSAVAGEDEGGFEGDDIFDGGVPLQAGRNYKVTLIICCVRASVIAKMGGCRLSASRCQRYLAAWLLDCLAIGF
jgi:hypothetical protein